jgi:hypothetical protein
MSLMFVCLPLAAAAFSASAAPAAPGASAPPTPPVGDHAACERALVSQAPTEADGIAAEHRWTAQNYPGSTWVSQELFTDCPQGPMDRITLDTAAGQRVIYFNIGSFFGHY